MEADETYMQRCFQLALLGKQNVKPNPMVGALLVHNGRIIGEGYHQQYGSAHAEVNCLQQVAKTDRHLLPESTMYVSLEPCIHYGKTPPCADLVIASGIKRVVVGCGDPFKQVNGGGLQKLRDAGIEVTAPFLKDAAVDLNKRFFTFHTRQRPYIILKWAQSNDGKISSIGERYHISNDITNALVHRWRSEEGAILIGTNTAIIDNPSLTTRLWPGGSPLRVVIDMKLRIPSTSVLYTDDEHLVLFNGLVDKVEGRKIFRRCNGQNTLQEILTYLHSQNITSLLVEGGGITLQSFIDAGLWDEARVITNKSLYLSAGVDAPTLQNGVLKSSFQILTDEVQFFTNEAARY